MSEQIIDLGAQHTSLQKTRSGLATASLICSLIICCPVATLVGVILGIVALLKMRGSQMTGRGLAWAGIIVGVLATVFSTLFIVFAANAAMSVLDETPKAVTTALKAGISGDVQSFRSEFAHDAVSANDKEVSAFIATLTSRYGTFDEAVIDMQAMQVGQQSSNDQAEIPLQLVFETKTIPATVTILIQPNKENLLTIEIRLQCLLVHDSDKGDVAFPQASQCGSAIPANEE